MAEEDDKPDADKTPTGATVPAAGDDDDMAAWGEAASEAVNLDQNSIDNLFGGAAEMDGGPQRGLEVLIGTAIVGYARLPTLDIVIDRFARRLTTSLRKITQENCDVVTSKSRAMRVGDFLNRITLPAMIAVIRAEQWDGHLLGALSAPLIGSIVDVLMGGRRNPAQPIDGRPYTPIERTMVERLIGGVVIGDMKAAFDSVAEIDFAIERFESTPSYAAITELSAAAVTFRIEITIDNGRGGWIDFLIPYAVLEPIQGVLSQEFIGKKQNIDPTWLGHMQTEVPNVMVEVSAELEHKGATVRHVMGWRPGSLLHLETRAGDLVNLLCEKMVVARVRVGENDGHIAFQVEECLNPATADDPALPRPL